MVAAIPANMASPNNGKHTQNRRSGSHRHRNDTCLGSLDHGSAPAPCPSFNCKSDFVHQHDRILDIHTDQSQQTEHGKEVE